MSDSLSLSGIQHYSLSHMQYGSVPLMAAAREGHTETVSRLLELGVNVNIQEKVT